MICPNCSFDNPDNIKFCGECGNKFEKTCSDCGFSNPSQFKFCGECGAQISDSKVPDLSSIDEKIDKIQRYLPQGLTDKILAQRDRIEGERKIVTVLFCDLVGYTNMVSKLDPEEAFTLMDQVLEILIHKVHDYGGTVNQLLGDGLYALFGAPIALEDGPQRAIRSAMDMHKELTRFSEKITKEKTIAPLRMRIGINTGAVVMGTIGNSLRVDFTAVGDTVNLASRMEGLAEPGAIYVTEETFKSTEHFFRFESLGEKTIKGFDSPIIVFRVIDRTNRSTRFDVSAERGLTPLVGRQRELEILLDGYEMTKSGRGQAFSIVAEAGVGKSRLLFEFRKAVANENVTILEGKCLSFVRNVAYKPVIDILKAYFQIEDDDDDKTAREKAIKGLQTINADEGSTLPYLLDLLGVKESGIKELDITPELKKDRMVDSVRRIVIQESELRPLIIIFEDLHWMDDASEKLLNEILEIIPTLKVLLLFSYRPSYVHTRDSKSYHSLINLNRLPNWESLSMLYHILKTDDVEKELEELILDRTEGNPFYMEEHIKALKVLKYIEKRDKFCLIKDVNDLTIPASIQDVIMARVDALPEEAREVLQTGSVIEREFSFSLLKKVMSRSENELLSSLSVLIDSELIYERALYPYTTYIFKHAIARDVVYDSILNKKKINMHHLIGAAIEDIYRLKIDEHYEILTEHYLAGENYEKGAEYAKLAAQKAANAVLWANAIKYTRKRIVCLEGMSETDSTAAAIITSKSRLAMYYLNLTDFAKAKETVAPIVDQAETLNLRRNLPVIYSTLGNYYGNIEENFEKSIEYLEKGLRIASEEGDFASIASISLFLGVMRSSVGEFDKAEELYKNALKLAEAGNALSFVSIIKGNMCFSIYAWQGKTDLSYRMSESALRLALDQDEQTKGVAYSCHGISCCAKGLFDEAIDYLEKGIALLEKVENFSVISVSTMVLGNIYRLNGEYEKSRQVFEKSVQFSNHFKSPSLLADSHLHLVNQSVLEGRDVNISEMLEWFEKIKATISLGSAVLIIGEVFMNIDDRHMPEAEEWIIKAIKINTQNGFRFILWQAHHLYFQFFKKQNKLPQAREQMNKAINIMKECGADGWVERYERELAELS